MIAFKGMAINTQTVYISGHRVAGMWARGVKIYGAVGTEIARITVDFSNYDTLDIIDGVFKDGYIMAMVGDTVRYVKVDFMEYDTLEIIDGVFKDGYMEAM